MWGARLKVAGLGLGLKVQGLLDEQDTQCKNTNKKMRCGRELFHVRTPHRISADFNILTSAHTGFVDRHKAKKKGVADFNTV
jgi:hypothetical protein